MLQKLNNMKIKKRLIVCFVMIVVMASISGILGVVLLTRTDQSYSHALIENGFSQGDIGVFNTYLNKGSAVVRDIVLLTDEADIQASIAEMNDIQNKTTEALEKLKENCKTPEELVYIGIIEEDRKSVV